MNQNCNINKQEHTESLACGEIVQRITNFRQTRHFPIKRMNIPLASEYFVCNFVFIVLCYYKWIYSIVYGDLTENYYLST